MTRIRNTVVGIPAQSHEKVNSRFVGTYVVCLVEKVQATERENDSYQSMKIVEFWDAAKTLRPPVLKANALVPWAL